MNNIRIWAYDANVKVLELRLASEVGISKKIVLPSLCEKIGANCVKI